MIEINGLKKSYGSRPVLKGIDLSVRAGRITGIAGPNACGKTTLIKCILGLSIMDAGTILVDGTPVRFEGSFREKLGYMPQNPRFPENLALGELLQMLEALRGEAAPRKDFLIEYFSLGKLLGEKVKQFSGGTRQKASAVAAMMFDSPVLLLDEPTAGMDPIVSLRFKSLLKEEAAKGKTIMLVSHLMPEVEQLATALAFLHEGKVIFSGEIDLLLRESGLGSLEPALTRIFEEKIGGSP
jgi:Cu-processing system ATP-binding protein